MINLQNIFGGLSLVIIVFILVLGFLTLLRGPRTKSNYVFFGFIIFVVFWLLANYFLRIVSNDATSLIILKFTFSISAVMLSLLLFFSLDFPKNLLRNSNFINILISLPTLFIVYLAHTDAIVSGFTRKDILLSPNYEWAYPIFIAYILIYLFLTFIVLIAQYRSTSDELKQQVRFLFIGIILSGIIASITDLVIPILFKTSVFANFDALGIIFLVGFATYAILKHHLLDVRVIVTETATALIILVILAQTLLSQTTGQWIINGVVLIFVIYGGYLIIKSVQHEIRQKEELQLLSNQLAQANTHLKELDAMKTEFVSLASHELLTPVSAIEGYLSMLLDEKMAKVEDPTAKRYLDNVYKSAKRLARLIADMLNISRIEEGRLSVEKKEIDVSDVIQQVIDEVRFKAEERHQKIEFQKDGWHSYADPDKLKEVVINLVGNSIKYSLNPGTIKIEVRRVPTQLVQDVWQRIEDEIKGRPLDDQEAIKSAVDSHYRALVGDEQLLISVKDQGVGIPREELPRLFKKFHRVGNYSTQESQGTGLGLYISRALTELQHGRIWPDSEGEGKGSTFSFTLPDVKAKDAIIALEAQSPQDKEKLKPLAKPMKSAAEEL